MRHFLILLSVLLGGIMTAAGQSLSLDSCRSLAIRNNKTLQMSSLKQEAAHWQRKSALTNYLPKISAVGTYQRTSREVSLLNDEQKDGLSHMGSNLAGTIGQGVQQGAADFQQRLAALPSSPEFQALMQNPQVQAILAQNPQLAQMLVPICNRPLRPSTACSPPWLRWSMEPERISWTPSAPIPVT